MMAGNVWRRDHYNLRKYSPTDIDYFLDIGACVGTTSVFFKAIVPFAKVIAIEPCIEDYEELCRIAAPWDIICHNIAFGNGEKLCYDNKRGRGTRRFYTLAEKQWWPEPPEYFIKSMSLPEMFDRFGISGRYIIKLDTEGGERFLLEDEQATEIIKGVVQLNIELHAKFGGELERWCDWFDMFKDTHTLSMMVKKEFGPHKERIYCPVDKPIKTWRRDYMLVKK
jgi:FkbM family methyltransferase